MNKPWIVAGVIVILIIGAGLGLAGGALLFDDDAGSEPPAAAPITVSEDTCEEARAVVDAAQAEMTAINESDNQDASFFAALIVQQRSVTFVMDETADCFTLQERAAAIGLLDGIEALLAALGSTAGSDGPASTVGDTIDAPTDTSPQDTAPEPVDSVPGDSSSTDE